MNPPRRIRPHGRAHGVARRCDKQALCGLPLIGGRPQPYPVGAVWSYDVGLAGSYDIGMFGSYVADRVRWNVVGSVRWDVIGLVSSSVRVRRDFVHRVVTTAQHLPANVGRHGERGRVRRVRAGSHLGLEGRR